MDNLGFAQKLEKRTEKFADEAIRFCRKLNKDPIILVIINQLVRSATSIGVNYLEANEALSKKDFFHRIRICRKESKETRYWLRRLRKIIPPSKHKAIDSLIKESTEFVLLFSKIVSKAN